MQYLARHGKVWQHKKSGVIGTDRLELTAGEKLMNYRQIPKPTEPPLQRQGKKGKETNKKEGVDD